MRCWRLHDVQERSAGVRTKVCSESQALSTPGTLIALAAEETQALVPFVDLPAIRTGYREQAGWSALKGLNWRMTALEEHAQYR
ncbi:hypothetical protein Atep_07240 [Allochromatium tepidum]|uniref:Uncharacterized protein n=1 Tax=Allochromatium tepidum TaxID=553982 RepID=A0ABM7QJV0_9GAMM|nr:hypothetical protein Atep_07240 [Allochromatium tepidum]